MTTDDLERRLREAFEAKATGVTPSMMDMDREREFADELDDDRGPRRWMVGGLSAAAAVAAAIGIGVVVSNQGHPTREPVVAATSHHTETSASTQLSSPSSTPLRHPELQSDMPPQTTQVPPPTTQTTVEPPPPPASTTTTTAPKMSPESSSAPSHSTSAPTTPKTSSDGNYYLNGDLRRAAGVSFLPLPASPSTTVVDQTSRTTRLSTDDCAAILSYWKTAMPANGWKQAPSAGKGMWFTPNGDAWAFTDKTSGACTIQISAGP